MREETEHPDAVGDAHDHDALLRQPSAIVGGAAGLAAEEAPAINPHHHRQLIAGRLRWCPHVQIQTIFTDARGTAEDRGHVRILRTSPRTCPPSSPRSTGSRAAAPSAQVTNRALRTESLEGDNAAGEHALHRPPVTRQSALSGGRQAAQHLARKSPPIHRVFIVSTHARNNSGLFSLRRNSQQRADSSSD